MKKIVMCLLVILLGGLMIVPAASAATVNVQVVLDSSTRQVTLKGTISSGENQQVTVLVEAPDGAIDFLDQTTSGLGGAFEFTYKLEPEKTGTYTARVGGTEVDSIAVTTFEYTGKTDTPNDSGNGSSKSSSSSNDEEDQTDKIQLTDHGVQINPAPKSLKKRIEPDGTKTAIYTFTFDTLDKVLHAWETDDEEIVELKIEVEEDGKVVLDVPEEVTKSIQNMNSHFVLALQTSLGYYYFPLQLLLEEEVPEGSLQVTIAPVEDDVLEQIREKMGSEAVHAALQFEIEIVQDDDTTTFDDFGSTYVERGIVLQGKVDPSTTTVVMVLPDKNELRFVPAMFHDNEDYTVAVFKRNGNSIYAVINHEKTFSDIGSHWAKEDIELLASKLIINGISDELFAPDESLTRAQFAALLVRSLGIVRDETSDPSFHDVSSDAWYADAVAIASKAGLVTGYADGSFRPDERISREQITVMLARHLPMPDMIQS